MGVQIDAQVGQLAVVVTVHDQAVRRVDVTGPNQSVTFGPSGGEVPMSLKAGGTHLEIGYTMSQDRPAPRAGSSPVQVTLIF